MGPRREYSPGPRARSIWKLAENGIMWCGTLCASVSIAAKWSYWLLVAVVLVFCLQLLLWTISWVILPCMRHLIALYRYLMGRGAWHEVVNLHGVSTFRPRWYGPKGQHEWTAEYIQQQARGGERVVSLTTFWSQTESPSRGFDMEP